MNKREIKRWRKALDETEERYRKAKWINGILTPNDSRRYRDCSLCRIAQKRTADDSCLECLAVLSGVAGLKRWACRCVNVIESADYQRRRRPIFRAIARMRRYLDKQEAELGGE